LVIADVLALFLQRTLPVSKSIHVGVVGGGYWGRNVLRNFHSTPGCLLKMISDTSATRLDSLRALYPEVAAETEFGHMLNGIGLHAIVIATPLKQRFERAKAALLAGKHVLIEKPMALSIEEGEELVDIAVRKGLVLMVGHTQLHSPAVRKIKEMIDGGNLGEIRYISARHLDSRTIQRDANVAWELAPRELSIILHLMGQLPQTVSCCGGAHLSPGIEDVASISLDFSRDRTAMVHTSWLEPHNTREMTIVGTQRMLIYDAADPMETVRVFDARVTAPSLPDVGTQGPYTYHNGDITVSYLSQPDPFADECRHFLDCIRKSKQPLTCGVRGLDMLRILEAANTSMKRGGARVPYARPQPNDVRLQESPILAVSLLVNGGRTSIQSLARV
jgi:predicted dehydrogenase